MRFDTDVRNLREPYLVSLMKLHLSPSFPKLVAPILFIVAAVLPEVHFAADPILFYPFYPFLGFEPFVYHDKPWFVTPIGGLFAAIVWGSLIYLLSSIRRR